MLLMFSCFVLAIACRVVSDLWLSAWVADSFGMSKGYYILVFFILVIMVNILFYVRGIIFARFAIKSGD